VGRKAAVPDAKLLALSGDDLTMFTEVERLVIELADAMAATPAQIADDLYARLRGHFSEEQLMELAAQIAFENYRSRWNRVFDVGSDHLYQPEAGAH
jgi:alkylhydroperoxidase family enzyme